MGLNYRNAWARVVDRWQSMTINEIWSLLQKLALATIVCSLAFFYFVNEGNQPQAQTRPEQHTIQLSDASLDRDLDSRIEERVQLALEEYFSKVDEKLAAASDSQESTTDKVIDTASNEQLKDVDELDFGDSNNIETPQQTFPPSQTSSQNYQPPPPPVFQDIGGITKTTYEVAKPKEEATNVEKFTIPVGFMPAKMLVGVRAQTSSDGASNPKPVHFRVQAPATLPNKVRMNLAGCFVIANTWGNLSTERIEGELKSIHCVSRDKKTLIEGDISGYLADTDGQRDMHGRVVTKAGALLSRQILADIFGGIGNVVANSAGTTQTSALGTVTTLDTDEMFQSGLASGVSSGFQRTSEFISSLVVQSGPVIESGAAKDVVLMIQKTSEIEVKTLETDS